MNIIWRPAPTGNFRVGRSARIDQITFHHIVGDAAAAIARFSKVGEQASSTFVIGSDGKIYQMVKEADTPYTDTSYSSNSRAITIEHAGGHHTVPYTEKMYQASIELVRDIRSRYNITRFMRHRDVAERPTACPGTLDVERIVRESGKGKKIMDTGTVHNLYLSGWQRMATPEELKTWVGKPMEEFFYGGGKNQYEWLWEELRKRDTSIAGLVAQLGDQGEGNVDVAVTVNGVPYVPKQ